MALYYHLPVYKTSYDLLLAIFQLTKNFSREYKYSVGQDLKKIMTEMILNIYRANSQTAKKEIIQKGRENLEVIRLYIRLLKDLKQISTKATGSPSYRAYWSLDTENTTGQFRFRVYTTVGTNLEAGTITLGEWTQAIAVYDGATMKLYQDGKLVGSRNKSGDLDTDSDARIFIGRDPSGIWNRWVDGLIDEVKIWNYALTPEQVRTEYNGGAVRFGQ